MTQKYRVPCSCGEKLTVELWNAGSNFDCPRCRQSVQIPNSIKLKEMSGDPYPHLGPMEKIRETAGNRESPFDGHCHGCGNAKATVEIPLALFSLKERSINEPTAPVLPIITPFFVGVAWKKGVITDETWDRVDFPAQLCDRCHHAVNQSNSWIGVRTWLPWILSLGVMYFAWSKTTREPVISLGLGAMVSAFLIYMLSPRAGQDRLGQIVTRIPIVKECLSTSLEPRLVVGTPIPRSST